jgi:hypothetical protein
MDMDTLNKANDLNSQIKGLSEHVAQLEYMLENFDATLIDVAELEITLVGYDGGGAAIEESVTLSSYSETPNFGKRKKLIHSLLSLEVSNAKLELDALVKEFNSLK